MIGYQRCSGCGAVWYFRRVFCPECGRPGPADVASSGSGSVAARTLVHRAPTPELREFAPYLIVLVDVDEGFRMMAHGEPELEIGDRVTASTTELAGTEIPFFARP
jgi:uncharacterized OB-fold protein